jgi:hypothetical protein
LPALGKSARHEILVRSGRIAQIFRLVRVDSLRHGQFLVNNNAFGGISSVTPAAAAGGRSRLSVRADWRQTTENAAVLCGKWRPGTG